MPEGGYNKYTIRQLAGSEYTGVPRTRNTIQPKGVDALSAGDRLRLGYLTGDTSDTYDESLASLEDRRQMLGLKPSGERRPNWLANTGRVPEAFIQGAPYPDEMIGETP